MALNTHHWFSDSLNADERVMAAVKGNIYLDAYNEELNGNLPLPYIIVQNNGTVNDEGTKDFDFEGNFDSDSISLEVAADSDEALVNLCKLVRSCIHQAAVDFDEADEVKYGFELTDYTFKTNGISLDVIKPCYWTELSYQCETKNSE